MPVSPFTVDAGVYQGRIQNPVNHTVATGSWTYVLGHDLKNQVHTLMDGDGITVEQSEDLNDAVEARVFAKVRMGETALPAGWKWVFQIEVDGTDTFTFDLEAPLISPGEELVMSDDGFGINVANVVSGNNVDMKYSLFLDGPAATQIDAELPAIYIDAVSYDEFSDAIYLTGKIPETADINVTTSSFARLVIASTTGAAIVTADTEVYVRGTLAYDGGAGGFQTGFSGTATSGFGVGTTDLYLFIDLSAQTFTSEEVVTVRVVSETTGGADTIDETYSFTIEDFASPSVTDATAREKRTLRVTFDEAVKQVSATATNDALNPANYSFARTTAPAANVNAECVVSVSPTVVDVVTDISMTFNAGYQLTLKDIEDLAGNVIAFPGNATTFTAFTPIIPAGRRFTLYDMLPAINRREDVTQDLQNFTGVLQESTNLLLCLIDRFTDIIDIDIAPEFYVDLILCDLGNPFTFNLSLIDKRRLARVLVDIYREKGTCQGIINAVRFFLGVEIDCDEFNVGDYWSLGEDELGTESILGPGEQSLLYSFQLISAEIQDTTITVNAADDGDYDITINSTTYSYTAATNTITEIRDALLALIQDDLDIPVTATAVSTNQIQLIGDAGTAFSVMLSAPVTGNLTSASATTPTAFTDTQVAIIKDIADYMKPAHTHCVRVLQPVPPDFIDHWEIGESELGETTLLH